MAELLSRKLISKWRSSWYKLDPQVCTMPVTLLCLDSWVWKMVPEAVCVNPVQNLGTILSICFVLRCPFYFNNHFFFTKNAYFLKKVEVAVSLNFKLGTDCWFPVLRWQEDLNLADHESCINWSPRKRKEK